MAKEYEVLSPINFGDGGENDKREYKGEHQPGARLTLDEDLVAQQVEAGTLKEVDSPNYSSFEPEEYGYAGEEARNEALDNDPVYKGESEPNATPAAQNKANELGVDLSDVSGSGNDGKIVVADVEKAAENK